MVWNHDLCQWQSIRRKWNKGLRNGIGTYTYANGDIFQESGRDGRKNGKVL